MYYSGRTSVSIRTYFWKYDIITIIIEPVQQRRADYDDDGTQTRTYSYNTNQLYSGGDICIRTNVMKMLQCRLVVKV